jgi:S-adenosylmethionine-diacylgycerolhomoserine-N-methlytransferase
LAQMAVQRFYRYQAGVYDLTRWVILRRRQRAVEKLELRPTDKVLEVGCGTGLNFRLILERLDPRAGSLTGVDFSPYMLKRARRRVRRAGWPNVELIEADATQLSLGRQFDAVLFAYSLAMMSDWRAALRCAWEHLRPRGRLVVLEFGRFEGWGLAGRVAQWWLRFNHVETARPYVAGLRELMGEVEVESWLSDYCFVAAGRRKG